MLKAFLVPVAICLLCACGIVYLYNMVKGKGMTTDQYIDILQKSATKE